MAEYNPNLTTKQIKNEIAEMIFHDYFGRVTLNRKDLEEIKNIMEDVEYLYDNLRMRNSFIHYSVEDKDRIIKRKDELLDLFKKHPRNVGGLITPFDNLYESTEITNMKSAFADFKGMVESYVKLPKADKDTCFALGMIYAMNESESVSFMEYVLDDWNAYTMDIINGKYKYIKLTEIVYNSWLSWLEVK